MSGDLSKQEEELSNIHKQTLLAKQDKDNEKLLLTDEENVLRIIHEQSEALANLNAAKEHAQKTNAEIVLKKESLQKIHALTGHYQKRKIEENTNISQIDIDYKRAKMQTEETLRRDSEAMRAKTAEIRAETKRLNEESSKKAEKVQKELEKAKAVAEREQAELAELKANREKLQQQRAKDTAVLQERVRVSKALDVARLAANKQDNDDEEEDEEDDDDGLYDPDIEYSDDIIIPVAKSQLGKRRAISDNKSAFNKVSKVNSNNDWMIETFAPIGQDIYDHATAEEKRVLKNYVQEGVSFSNFSSLLPLDRSLRDRIASGLVEEKEVFQKLAEFITKYVSDEGSIEIDIAVSASEVLTMGLLVGASQHSLRALNDKVKEYLSSSVLNNLNKNLEVRVSLKLFTFVINVCL